MPAANLLLVTIDTLRADAVGAYGGVGARTPAIDAIAASGLRFDRAFAPAPITLPSHASLLTGLYPPGHGARHNGIPMRRDVPTLAEAAAAAGFATAAFVSAFPLDRRFGLDRGFAAYDDRLPRGPDLRALNERAGSATVDAAIAWLETTLKSRATGASAAGAPSTGTPAALRFFLWVHLFEPHAPYGDARTGRSARERYADEVAEADRQTQRLADALGSAKATTLIVIAGDHGEAFGEHGEIGHSIFVYDTTLRVPLVMSGPGLPQGRAIAEPVSLVDVAPTVLSRLGLSATPPHGSERSDVDGIDLQPLWAMDDTDHADPNSAGRAGARVLYAESFAPLVDFGWSALRSVRRGGWKYIAAPRPELYDLTRDPEETNDLAPANTARAAELDAIVSRVSGPERQRVQRPLDREAADRLRALGYASAGLQGAAGLKAGGSTRADPKDRRALAARIARVTSGELTGDALLRALDAIVAEDPSNPQAHLRLGFAHAEAGACANAERHFAAAIASGLPSADPYLGLAGCQTARGDRISALRTLERALAVDVNDAVVLANIGILRSALGRHAAAIDALERALARDPDFHEARFNLALALATAGRRTDAARQARKLLERLPSSAPQRAEVERLLSIVEK